MAYRTVEERAWRRAFKGIIPLWQVRAINRDVSRARATRRGRVSAPPAGPRARSG